MTPAGADAELRAIGARLATEHPKTDHGATFTAHALREHYVGADGLRPVMLLLLGAVGFVLLIACANVASLQLARTAARRREILLRASLGASRGRLVRQLLTESLLLAVAGGAAGLLAAHAGLRLLDVAVPVELPRWLAFDIDWRVLAFTAGISMLAGVTFGLTPALGAGRVRVAEALKAGPRAGAGRDGTRLRSALVVGQIALSLVLVVGATLLIQSFVRLQGSRLGFDAAGALVVRVSLAGERYATAEQRAAFHAAALERVRALPGVTSAASVTGLTVANDRWNRSVEVEGRPAPERPPRVIYTGVAGDYFDALSMPLAEGRPPRGRETTTATARVAVVNETMARRLWPEGGAVGARVRLPEEDSTANGWYTVVGIARDGVQRELGQPIEPQIFATGAPGHMTRLVVRASSDRAAAALAPLVRASLAGVDPGVPAFEPLLMRDVLARNESYWLPRLWSGLLGAFAAVALAIAAVGLFGVISYVVRQRSHELGVRLALGATPRDVLRLVLGRGVRLAIAGIVLGVLGAAATTRLLASLLYGVEASDPATFVAVPLLILAVALLASWLPARRAMRADPVAALRTE